MESMNSDKEFSEGLIGWGLFALVIALIGMATTGCSVGVQGWATPVSEHSVKMEYKPKKMHVRCIWGSCEDAAAQQVGEGS